MRKIRFTTWAEDLHPPSFCSLDSAHHAACIAWSMLIEKSTTYVKFGK